MGLFSNGGRVYLARIDGNTVILVVDLGSRDCDVGALSNVETIGVSSKIIRITISVVNGDVCQSQIGRTIDTEDLHRGVLDIDALDRRGSQVVGRKEFGLSLATVTSLSIPPAAAIAVQNGTTCALDRDIGSGYGDERALPFFVPEGGLAFEDDLIDSISATLGTLRRAIPT